MTTIVDVRSAAEYANGHIDNAVNMPVDELAQRLNTQQCKLDKQDRIILYCAAGGRAGVAKSLLDRAGFTNVVNAGGYQTLRQQIASL